MISSFSEQGGIILRSAGRQGEAVRVGKCVTDNSQMGKSTHGQVRVDYILLHCQVEKKNLMKTVQVHPFKRTIGTLL